MYTRAFYRQKPEIGESLKTGDVIRAICPRIRHKIYTFIALRPSFPSFESLGELNYKAARSYDTAGN